MMLASPLLPSAAFSPKNSTAPTEDSLSFRPARDVDAFNSLLPPPIEFVEGSSSGALAVPEGKYQPINVSPKLSTKDSPDGSLLRHKSPASTTITSPTRPAVSTPSPSAKSAGGLLSHAGIDLTWPETCERAVGLHNTGNTCFLNSVLQCLLHTPPLLQVVIAHSRDKCRTGDKFCMTCAFRQVTVQAYKGSTAFAPYSVSNRLQTIAKHMRRGRQEDSHEFLRYAIDAMQKSCLSGAPPKLEAKFAETTWVHKIFGGKLRSRVSCQNCGHNSDTFDRILDLSLDIMKADSLTEALRSFVSPDYLKGTDKYKCEKCKLHVNAEKRFTIHEAPPILTVHLKRFSPLGRKIGHHVTYDETLSLQPYMSKEAFGPTYTLYGVICHVGGGPNSGHYYAFVKSRSGKWYEMNDEMVSPISGLPLSKKTAYILFFMRNKGQGLQAALKLGMNGVHKEKQGLHFGMKKRRDRDDDDDDDDVGEKVVGSPGKFIGPLLPSPMEKTPSAPGSPTKKLKTHHDSEEAEFKLKKTDPQAEKIKQRILATNSKDATQARAKKALAVLDNYDSSDVDGADEDKAEAEEEDGDEVGKGYAKADKGKGKARAIVQSDEEDVNDHKGGVDDPSPSSPLREKHLPPSSSSTHEPSSPISSFSFYGSTSKTTTTASKPDVPSSKQNVPQINGKPANDHSDHASTPDSDTDDDDEHGNNPSPMKTVYHNHRDQNHKHHHRHHRNPDNNSPSKHTKHKGFMDRTKMRMSMDSNGHSRNGERSNYGQGRYVTPFSRIGSENSAAMRNGGRLNTYGKRQRRPRGL